MHKKSLHEHVFSIFIGDSEHVLIGIDAYLYMLLAHPCCYLLVRKKAAMKIPEQCVISVQI